MNRKLFYGGSAAVALVLLTAAIVPNIARTRFMSSGEPITFEIKVVDGARGTPVPGAGIAIGAVTGVTDDQGNCTIVQHFPATGRVGRSGTCSFTGALRVTAPDFVVWEQSLPGIFGASYDYFNRGATITQVVKLEK